MYLEYVLAALPPLLAAAIVLGRASARVAAEGAPVRIRTGAARPPR